MRAAGLAVALALGAAAAPASARPYLMLDADDHGFKALDLGALQQDGQDAARATLIEAPLAGAPIGDKLAPLVQRRFEVDCLRPRWRLLGSVYADAREVELGREDTPGPWADFEADPVPLAVQQAACAGRHDETLVSRRRNLAEILAQYQAAHSRAAPQPPTEKELAQRRFRNGH